MAKNNSFATLGLVSIVAVVGVVGLLTLMQGGNTVAATPVQQGSNGASASQGSPNNTAGKALMFCSGGPGCPQQCFESASMAAQYQKSCGQKAEAAGPARLK